MSNYEKYKMFCLAFGESLHEVINDAITKKKNLTTDKDDFYSGYLDGIYRVITLMQQQAEIFEITFEELGINFEETDLII